MKYLFYPSFLILVASFMSVSCTTNTDYSHEVAVVDSLQIHLDEAVQQYTRWNVDSLSNIRASMKVKLGTLANILNQKKDTISKEDGFFLGDYKSASDVFKNIIDKNKIFRKEIDYSNKQLANLKSDLQSGTSIPADSIESCLQTERKAVRELIASLQLADSKFATGVKKHAEMTPKVDSLLEQLTKKEQ